MSLRGDPGHERMPGFNVDECIMPRLKEVTQPINSSKAQGNLGAGFNFLPYSQYQDIDNPNINIFFAASDSLHQFISRKDDARVLKEEKQHSKFQRTACNVLVSQIDLAGALINKQAPWSSFLFWRNSPKAADPLNKFRASRIGGRFNNT